MATIVANGKQRTMRADNEPRTKRPKNKQDRPAMSDSEDIPSNDEDRKPAGEYYYLLHRTAYLAYALAQTKAQEYPYRVRGLRVRGN
jgi:hypothetical protein